MSADSEIVSYLRKVLVPQGTSQIVQIGFLDGGLGGRTFYDHAFIVLCLNDMAKLNIRAALGDPISNLERLAVQLLLASAYISKPEQAAKAIESQNRWEQENRDDRTD
jgi:hypothetical protein